MDAFNRDFREFIESENSKYIVNGKQVAFDVSDESDKITILGYFKELGLKFQHTEVIYKIPGFDLNDLMTYAKLVICEKLK